MSFIQPERFVYISYLLRIRYRHLGIRNILVVQDFMAVRKGHGIFLKVSSGGFRAPA